jgi:RNA polymerase primary sigma factor
MIVRMIPDPDLSKFLSQTAKHPLLTQKEELALLALARAGNEDARRKVCAHNLKFVIRVALKFVGVGLPLKDLVHEGTLGMMDAVHRFDPNSGNKFISYAVWWIRHAILLAVANTSRTIRISAEHESSVRRLKKSTLRQVIGGLYVEDLDGEADRSGIRADFLGLSLQAARGGLSLDQPVTDAGGTPSDIVPSPAPQPDELTEARERVDILNRLRGKLSPQHRQVITLCFGLDGGHQLTLREIGIRMNLSHERIRQVKEEAIRKMRAMSGKYTRDIPADPRKKRPSR